MTKIVITLPESLRDQVDTLAMQTGIMGYDVNYNNGTCRIEVGQMEPTRLNPDPHTLEKGFPPEQIAHLREQGCTVEIF